MKTALKFVAGIVVVLIVAAVVVVLAIDTIVARGVEEGAGYALGVDVEVDDMDVGLVGGTVGLEQLTVSNPEGFTSPHLMQSGAFDLAVRPGSLWSGPVEVRRFEIAGLDVHLEQRLEGSNVSVVLANLKRFATGEEPGAEPEAEGRRIKADLIRIGDVVAHVHVLSGEGKGTQVTVPGIELKDVHGPDGQGVTTSELTALIVAAVMEGIVKEGGTRLPGDLAANITGGLADLSAGLEAGVEEVRTGLEEGTKKIGEGLKGLLGGEQEQ